MFILYFNTLLYKNEHKSKYTHTIYKHYNQQPMMTCEFMSRDLIIIHNAN